MAKKIKNKGGKGVNCCSSSSSSDGGSKTGVGKRLAAKVNQHKCCVVRSFVRFIVMCCGNRMQHMDRGSDLSRSC